MKINTRGLSLAGASIITSVVAGNALAGPQWVLDLGTLGGLTSQAYGLNASATRVVGGSDNGGEQQAFVYNVNSDYTGGSMIALSHLAGGNASEARAINASGLIAGYSRNGTNGASERAVLWNGTTPTLLNNVAGGTSARAYGLSDTGIAVGYVTVGGSHQAFSYIGGAMSILALDQNQFDVNGSEALSISGNGRYIVGKATSVVNLGEVHGFLFDTSTNTTYDMVSSSNTIGWGVSNNFASGQESGGLGFRVNNATHNSDGAITPHGGNGIAYDVNDLGEFVGAELDGNGNAIDAWFSNGTSTDELNNRFNDPNVNLLAATGVAEYHQMITGYGTFGGATHAFVLVPEPNTILGLMLGLPALCLARRKRMGNK